MWYQRQPRPTLVFSSLIIVCVCVRVRVTSVSHYCFSYTCAFKNNSAGVMLLRRYKILPGLK